MKLFILYLLTSCSMFTPKTIYQVQYLPFESNFYQRPTIDTIDDFCPSRALLEVETITSLTSDMCQQQVEHKENLRVIIRNEKILVLISQDKTVTLNGKVCALNDKYKNQMILEVKSKMANLPRVCSKLSK